jgi:hypothetical protein
MDLRENDRPIIFKVNLSQSEWDALAACRREKSDSGLHG